MRQMERNKESRSGKKKKEEGGEASELCIYSVILCICILLMFLLWNHFYSNPRLRRPSHGSVAGREGWMERGRRGKQVEILI